MENDKKNRRDLDKIKELERAIKTVEAHISFTSHTFYQDRINIVRNIEKKISIIKRRMEKRNEKK